MEQFEKQLKTACRSLRYISEIDSPVEPFFGSAAVTDMQAVLLGRSASLKRSAIRELPFTTFFDRLTKKKDWHTKDDEKRLNGFRKLRSLLEKHLRDLRVFKIGDVRIEIYVVGSLEDDRLAGVKMNAVET